MNANSFCARGGNDGKYQHRRKIGRRLRGGGFRLHKPPQPIGKSLRGERWQVELIEGDRRFPFHVGGGAHGVTAGI
jgi:hypothetical protein